jgi:hypothetical protein
MSNTGASGRRRDTKRAKGRLNGRFNRSGEYAVEKRIVAKEHPDAILLLAGFRCELMRSGDEAVGIAIQLRRF